MDEKELVKALKEGRLYDFISNNGHRFEKDQLIRIIKELDFAIYSLLGEETLKNVEKEVSETLFDFYEFDEDEGDEQ